MSDRPPTPALAPGMSGDGENTQLAALADRRHQRLLRQLSLPTWALAGHEIAWWAVVVVAALLEVRLLEVALARILPTATDTAVFLGSLAFVLVYALLWHGVGNRLAEAAALSAPSAAKARRIPPAFGVTGVLLVATLLAVLAAVSWIRAITLADAAARKAVQTAVDDAIPGLSGDTAGGLSEQATQRIYDTAWWSALWPDLLFTLAVMLMLAALSVWIGFGAHLRHEALSLHLARFGATRATHRARELAADHTHARRRADSQQVMADARAAHARRLSDSLTHRFARAKQVSRHLLATSQGQPDATTVLFPPPGPEQR